MNAQQMQQLAEFVPVAVAMFDRDMRYIFVNDRWRLDYDMGERPLIGESHYDVLGRIADDWREVHQHCIQGNIHRDKQISFIKADGRTEWIRREIRPWFTSDEEIGGLIIYTTRITEQIEIQDELQAQHRFLRRVIDLNTSFIFAKDEDGKFTLVNKALADHYDSEPDKMIGKIDEDFNKLQDETKHFREDDLEVIRTRRSKFIPIEPVTSAASGETRWYQTIKVPLVSEDGQSVQLLGIATDVTERIRAEEKLQELVVHEQQARREAEEASQMKDMFMANMSHELRTPMNAIMGFLREMLYSEQLNPDNTHMAERSLANSKRLLGLINSVLDLSRLATGGIELVPVPVTVRELAHYVIDDVTLQAKEKGLQLHLDIDSAMPDALVHDEERLTQIMMNLLVNAMKYTDEGSVTLKLCAINELLIINVRDTGVGIPEEMQAAIFDEFVQVKPGKAGGAGLGLSIVKSLVALMQGEISLQSEEGQFTEIEVKLPLNLTIQEGETS